MSTMKQAFAAYFTKLNRLYNEVFGTNPTVPYSSSLNKVLLVSPPDDEGEVPWQPKEQSQRADWSTIENDLGFILTQDIKEYYNSFFFLQLSGTFGSSELHFYPIDGSRSLDMIINQHYLDGQYVFPNSECLLIGNAVVNDDDSYFIFYDNSKGKLFCFESETKQQILLSYSIAMIIQSMEAII